MNDRTPHHSIPQEAFDWYDAYAHGDIDRRTFLARLGTLVAVGMSASSLARALMPDYALAEQVSFNDPTILASYAEFPSPDGHGTGRDYLVRPEPLEEETAPVVLVVHENRGLNPYIKDVARRFAKLGFVAFAPDALYPLGGYPGNDDTGREMQKSMERPRIEQDFIAAAKFLKAHAWSSGKLGVVGFCFGGYISNMLAAVLPDVVDAAAPFYGTPAADDLVSRVKGPLMIHFAENDTRVNDTWPAYKTALEASGAVFEAFTYTGTQHGFHNDSTSRYDKDAAEKAFGRTCGFFRKHLAAM